MQFFYKKCIRIKKFGTACTRFLSLKKLIINVPRFSSISYVFLFLATKLSAQRVIWSERIRKGTLSKFSVRCCASAGIIRFVCHESSTARTEHNSGIVLIFCRRLAVRDTAGILANFSFFYLCSFTSRCSSIVFQRKRKRSL